MIQKQKYIYRDKNKLYDADKVKWWMQKTDASINIKRHHKTFSWLILKVQQLMCQCQIKALCLKWLKFSFTGEASTKSPMHSGQPPTRWRLRWLHVGALYIPKHFVSVQTWAAWVLSTGQHIKSCRSICCLRGWILFLVSFLMMTFGPIVPLIHT